MKKLVLVSMLLLYGAAAFAGQDVVGAVEGTVKSVDRTGKVVIVDTGDGASHAFHYTKDLTVHVGNGLDTGAKDSLHGVAEGSKVAVHYTAVGSRETAHEVDILGEHGLKAVKGTVTHVDHRARKISIATADGTVETMKLTGRVADDSAKDIAKGAMKGAKVTVYYTEDAGNKTVHFISKALF